MTKVLGLVHGEYRSHTVRVLEIAKALRHELKYEISFSGNGECMNLIGDENFPWTKTDTLTKRRISDCLEEKVAPNFYDKKTVEKMFSIENELLTSIKPDIIIRDHFRELAAHSAKLNGIYDVSIQKAFSSPHYCFNSRPEKLPVWTKIFPKGSLKLFAKPIGKIIRKRKIRYLHRKAKTLGLDVVSDSHEGVEPDLVLIPDSEILYPGVAPKENHKYLGPMMLMPNGSLPDWFWQFINDERLKITITTGTTGEHEKTRNFIKAFDDGKYVVALDSEIDSERLPSNFFGGKIHNLDQIVNQSDLFITHGGTGSTYLGLLAGTPMLSIFNHLEQHANANQLRKLGVGRRLGHLLATSEKIRSEVDEMFENNFYGKNLIGISEELKNKPNAINLAVNYIEDGFKKFR